MSITGYAKVDLEHAELFALIELLRIYLESEFRNNVPLLVILFNTKLVKHCINEEAFLEEIKDPLLLAHKSAHKDLIALASSLLLKLETDHSFDNIAKDLEFIVDKHIELYDTHIHYNPHTTSIKAAT